MAGEGEETASPEQSQTEGFGWENGQGPEEPADSKAGIAQEKTKGAGWENSREDLSSNQEAGENKEELVVYVCGQVREPGVYTLQVGARIGDAVELAGGMTEEAAVDAINLAQTVGDAQMIRVPSLEEVEALGPGYVLPESGSGGAESGGDTGAGTSGQISLNRATRDQLMTLPGIGGSKADAILRYRQEVGAFENIEEIMNITGIKEGVFLKIKDQITI